jgi:hypothetical protein
MAEFLERCDLLRNPALLSPALLLGLIGARSGSGGHGCDDVTRGDGRGTLL